jgi:hypothetical protein
MPHMLRLIPHGTATSSTAYRQSRSTLNRNRCSSLFSQNSVSRYLPSPFPQYEDTSRAYTLAEELVLHISSNTTAQAALRELRLTQHLSTRAVAFFTRHVTCPCAMRHTGSGCGYALHGTVQTYQRAKCFGHVQFCALTKQNLADITEIQFFTQPESLSYYTSVSYFDQWEFWRGPNALLGLRRVTITIPWIG